MLILTSFGEGHTKKYGSSDSSLRTSAELVFPVPTLISQTEGMHHTQMCYNLESGIDSKSSMSDP
jgi:hypothetical protein